MNYKDIFTETKDGKLVLNTAHKNDILDKGTKLFQDLWGKASGVRYETVINMLNVLESCVAGQFTIDRELAGAMEFIVVSLYRSWVGLCEASMDFMVDASSFIERDDEDVFSDDEEDEDL